VVGEPSTDDEVALQAVIAKLFTKNGEITTVLAVIRHAIQNRHPAARELLGTIRTFLGDVDTLRKQGGAFDGLYGRDQRGGDTPDRYRGKAVRGDRGVRIKRFTEPAGRLASCPPLTGFLTW
jgi:hypothetical protein